MERTAKWLASSGTSSTLTLANSIWSPYFSASFSKVGASIRQGEHHSAQKSTNTGFSLDWIAGQSPA